MLEFSDYLVYVDESGDHGLETFGREFPVFVLSFCIFHRDDYVGQVVPGLQRMKFKHFGHDTIVFHERDSEITWRVLVSDEPGEKSGLLR